MSYAARLSLLCTLALATSCGTVEDLPPADAGSRKDAGFVLVEDPPGTDGGPSNQDGGAPDAGPPDGGATDAGEPDGGAPDPACGNSEQGAGEGCDDGNTDDGDGCSAACAVEAGFSCDGEPSACVAVCGDGRRVAEEECDDGNVESGDGCAQDCTLEEGFTCDGGTCTVACGDGQVVSPETCDDGNTQAGDGCSAACALEAGFTCDSGGCEPVCGDGRVVGTETCDDQNGDDGDGCGALCRVETGYACTGGAVAPSVCRPVCGDGVVLPPEACDDGATVAGDGCSATCTEEDGYDCSAGTCAPVCGDGKRVGLEACDDGNTTASDGCDEACAPEPGYQCTGVGAGSCTAVCGDGLVVGNELCDDRNSTAGDGCTGCQVDFGYTCSGSPTAPPRSVCETTCGDDQVAGAEACEPGLATPFGCTQACTALGGMKVTLAGAPAGTTAELTGPGGFAVTVTNGQQLTELVPGNYTLSGAPLVQAGSVVDTLLEAPTPLGVAVKGTVDPNEQAQPTFSWTLRGGTGALWVGSALTDLFGLPDATLASPTGGCTSTAQCTAGTACTAGGFCARSAAVGGRSHLAVVALGDGTLVFGGGASGTPSLTTYVPSGLAAAAPQPAQALAAGPNQALQVTWPGSSAPTEFSALAALPGGTVFAAAGDAVVMLPTPLGPGQALVTLSGMGQVLALAVTRDPASPGTEVLWVASRTTPQLTVVKGFSVGSSGLTEVADLAVDSSATRQDPFGAQVALAVAPDGLTLWMADGLPGTANQVRLQAFSLFGVPNATVEPVRTLFVDGYAAPTGLAVGKVDETAGASPLLLADDADALLLLPAQEVSTLSSEASFSAPAAWSVGAPSGLAFSPAAP